MKRYLFKKSSKYYLGLLSFISISGIILSACSGVQVGSKSNALINVGDRSKFSSDSKYSISQFTENVLTKTDASKTILHKFVQQLITNWFEKQSKIDPKKSISILTDVPKLYQDTKKRLRDQLAKQLSSQGGDIGSASAFSQREILDASGGNSQTYLNDKLLDSFYESFRTRFATLNIDSFSLKKNATFEADNKLKYDQKSYLSENDSDQFTKDDLYTSTNWSKIGFYPLLDQSEHNADNKNIAIGIASFANYAYSKWQETAKPVNVVMSLWKYDDKATKSQLLQVYNEAKLENHFPTKANYKFPYYGQKPDANNNLATNNAVVKFEQFTKNLDQLTPTSASKPDFNIPLAYTDDNGTSITANLNDIFDKLFPQFAAGVVHKFLQATGGKDWNDKTNSVANVNKISKDDLKQKDLISLFLAKKTDATTNQYSGIEINPEIFSSSNYKGSSGSENNFVLDQRDVENTPWLFLRNMAGVHAIAIDGYQYIKHGPNGSSSTTNSEPDKTQDALKRSYQFYNFKILEKISASRLNIQDKQLINTEPFADANKFIVDNFDAVIYDYYQTHKNDPNSIFHGVQDPSDQLLGSLRVDGKLDKISNPSASEDLKKALDALVKIELATPFLTILNNMGTKLQSEYLKFNLEPEQKTNGSTTDLVSNKENGLASVLPYPIDADFSSSSTINTNTGWYQTLAPIYNNDKYSSFSDIFDYSNTTKNNLKKLKKEHDDAIKSLITKLNLRPSQNLENPSGTQIILSNVDVFNSALNSYLSNDSNIASIITTNYNLNDYLKNWIDHSNYSLNQDSKLSNNLNSVSSNRTQLNPDNQSSTTNKIPLNNAINNTFFAKSYLSSENPLIYGGFQFSQSQATKTTSTQSSASNSTNVSINQFASNFNSKQKNLFDRKFYYETKNGYSPYSTNNNDYFKYLQTLEYLTKDRFENLRLYLKSAFSAQTNAAFAWIVDVDKNDNTNLNTTSAATEKFSNVKLNYQNKLINPFVNTKADFNFYNKEYTNSLNFTEVKNTNNTSSKAKRDVANTSSAKTTYRGFEGLIIENPNRTWITPNSASTVIDALKNIQSYTNSAKNGVLFSFGSRANLTKFINNFDTESDVTKTAEKLQNLVNTFDISSIKTTVVQLKKDTNDSNPTTHVLNFFEKKNALLALVNNHKAPNVTSAITYEEFKNFYGTDPTNNFVSVNNKYETKTSGTDFNSNIADGLFQRLNDVFESTNNKDKTNNKFAFPIANNNQFNQLIYSIQVNANDFETKENFLNLIANSLGDNVFANWLAQLASEKFFQDLASADFESTIKPVTVYDARFLKALAQKYITNPK
ncbi:DUF3713 family protein [[Mycoplasma] cavipharyngis]|uniref:DUF3713 domain-containing protein n=1 Tax=[Mycoplasma] cavipharyngis TaxID=92757 RepID=UPI0037039BA0